MGAVVCLEHERQRRERTCEYSAPEGAQVNHFAHLQRQFEASVGAQQSAGEITVLDAQLRRNLSQLSAHTLQGARLYVATMTAATAIAALILHQTERLLAHSVSLLTANNLSRGVRSCRSEIAATSREQTTEKFGEGA